MKSNIVKYFIKAKILVPLTVLVFMGVFWRDAFFSSDIARFPTQEEEDKTFFTDCHNWYDPGCHSDRMIHKCSDQERYQIENAHFDSINKIDGFISDIDHVLEYNSRDHWKNDTERQLLKAKRVLECSKRKMHQLVEYSCYVGPIAMVLTSGHPIAYVVFLGDIIHFGDKFFKRRKLFQTLAVVHEVTHLCGTWDAGYFWYEPPKNIDLELDDIKKMIQSNLLKTILTPTRFIESGIMNSGKWHTIASTYDFWVRCGFCIPEVDCHSTYSACSQL